MSWNTALQNIAQKLCDSVFELNPMARPKTFDKKVVQLVAHRGGYGPGLMENTKEAFMMAKEAGVWGLEMDVRWSKDFVPFVHHDATISKTSKGSYPPFANLNWQEISNIAPQICRLSEVIQLVKDACHLMIEVKEPLVGEREESLCATLKTLEPRRDFHLLTLLPEYLTSSQLPRDCYVFVTELNFKKGSDFVLENRWGGVAGHYLLLNDSLRQKHHEQGQKVGVGFVNGINNVYRQVSKQADWIFTDRAISLQQQL